jgi:hypothetical protein
MIIRVLPRLVFQMFADAAIGDLGVSLTPSGQRPSHWAA